MFNSTFITALDALLAQHGFARTMSRGNIIITDLQSKSDTGKEMLRMYGARFGLTEADHGTIFTFRGTRYKLIGLKPSRPRYPLECEHMGDGRVFKFDTGVVPSIVALRGAQPQAPAVPPMQLPQGFIPSTFTPPPGMPQF
jgi:hypothetical protein